MKRFLLSPARVAALALLLGGAVSAMAEVHYTGDSVSRFYECHHQGGPHPAKVEIVQYVNRDYEGWTSGRLMLMYAGDDGDRPSGPAGGMRARAKLFRADGSKVRLGTVRMGLSADDEGHVSQFRDKLVEMSLRRGDRVRWRVTFSGVSDLEPGDWFNMGVGIGSAETFEDP